MNINYNRKLILLKEEGMKIDTNGYLFLERQQMTLQRLTHLDAY